jgi:hypothetical protein
MFSKYLTIAAVLAYTCCSCGNNTSKPDVSDIKVDLTVARFDQDFFNIDTNNISVSLKKLDESYPDFTAAYVKNILGLAPDSVMQPNSNHAAALKLFIRDYRALKDSSDKLFGNFSDVEEDLETASKYVKHYFPGYQLPSKIITFIGPVDAMFQTSYGFQGDIITPAAFGVALQFHMGEKFSFYRSLQGQAQFPDYILRRLTPAMIPVNCMKTVVDDLFPDQSAGRPMIEQMVDRGRRLYLLNRFLPDEDEHQLIGYSKEQLSKCYENEAVIWEMFLNNDLLNNSESNIIKNYIGDSPKTQNLGDDAPGNIGSFSGWQIVKTYMEKFPNTKVEELMMMSAREVYAKSKYRPR